LITEN